MQAMLLLHQVGFWGDTSCPYGRHTLNSAASVCRRLPDKTGEGVLCLQLTRPSAFWQVGFQKDSKWMYSGSEDGTVRIWDLRAPGCQREYQSRAAVNTVVLHPNQGELISGARHCQRPVYETNGLGLRQRSLRAVLAEGLCSFLFCYAVQAS